MRYISAATVVLISLFLFVGCNNENDSINSSDTSNLIGPSPGIPLETIMDDYAQNIDTTKVIGNLELSNLNASIYDDTTFIFSENKATLFIFGPNDSSYTVQGKSLINSENMVEMINSSNRYWANGDMQDLNNLNLHFGSANSVQIGSTAISGAIDTTINLFDLTKITNIQNGDTISKSSGLTVNWNSTNTDYVGVNILQVKFPNSSDEGIRSGGCYLENTGNYTFPSSQLQSFPNGLYDITLNNFYPYFLYDDNQNIIIAVAQSKRRITVYLDD